jgi:uncharacterized membrane-anchored protein YitT (DUF2179 family)
MENEKKKWLTKSTIVPELRNFLFVIGGCLVLAFADAAFIIPCNIVNGGVDSMSVIFNYYLEPIFHINVSDIVIGLAQAVLWLVGLFFLGKKFSIYTLLGSVAFPLFYSLILRTDFVHLIGFDVLYNENGAINEADLILAGVFGGALSGVGVALTFLGNGSTGGFDIVSFVIAKYTEMKQDVSGFLLDSLVVVAGLICMNNVLMSLVGVISAFASALAVQFIYLYINSFVIVDIISDKFEEIQEFIHKEMGHGTTVIETIGGYTGEKRKMIRVVVYQMETGEIRSYIAATDPKAFVSFTQAKGINGEGFEPFVIPRKGVMFRKRASTQYKENEEGNKTNPNLPETDEEKKKTGVKKEE